ncbi:MAG: hypothetical protein K6F05_01565 [Succinivibrio sp.]|nr:hypothetical protein [Succinivibrio sp.]
MTELNVNNSQHNVFVDNNNLNEVPNQNQVPEGPEGGNTSLINKVKQLQQKMPDVTQIAPSGEADHGAQTLTLKAVAQGVSASFKNFVDLNLSTLKDKADFSLMYEKANLTPANVRAANMAYLDQCFIQHMSSCVKNATHSQNCGRTVQYYLHALITAERVEDLKIPAAKIKETINKEIQNNQAISAKELKGIKNFLKMVKELQEHKTAVIDEFNQRYKDYEQMSRNYAKLNLNKELPGLCLNSLNKKSGQLSSMCGCSFMSYGQSAARSQKIFTNHQYLSEKIALYKEIKTELTKETLKDTSYDQLKSKVDQQGDGNASLNGLLTDSSKKFCMQLKNDFKVLHQGKSSPAELRHVLKDLATHLVHDLSLADRTALLKDLSSLIAYYRLNPEENPDLAMVSQLAELTSKDETMAPAMGQLLQILDRRDFKSEGLAELGRRYADNVADGLKILVKDFAQAVQEPDKRHDFVAKIVKLSQQEPQQGQLKTLALDLSESFHYLDPVNCGHIHEGFFAYQTIVGYLNSPEFKDKVTELLNRQETNAQFADAQKAISTILKGPFENITRDDYSMLLLQLEVQRGSPWQEILEPLWYMLVQGSWSKVAEEQRTVQLAKNQPVERLPVTAPGLTVSGEGTELKRSDFTRIQTEFLDYVQLLIPKHYEKSRGIRTAKAENGVEARVLNQRLNTRLGGEKILEAVRNATVEGRKAQALHQMRQEMRLLHLDLNAPSFENSKQRFENLSADELLKVEDSAIQKTTVFAVNNMLSGLNRSQEQGATHRTITTLGNLIEANRKLTIPAAVPAVVRSILINSARLHFFTDQLVDDLYVYNDENLKILGIANPERLRVSAEVLKTVKVLGYQRIENGKFKPTAEQKQALSTLDAALDELRTSLRIFGKTAPLTPLAELIVRKYADLYALRHAPELSERVVALETALTLSSDAEYRALQNFYHSKELRENPLLIDNKDLKVKVDGVGMVKLGKLEEQVRQKEAEALKTQPSVLSFCKERPALQGSFTQDKEHPQLNTIMLSAMAEECGLDQKLVEEICKRERLDNKVKAQLLKKMQTTFAKTDLNLMTEGLQTDKEKLGFKGLEELAGMYDSAEFPAMLNEFINKELNGQRFLTAHISLGQRVSDFALEHKSGKVSKLQDELLPKEIIRELTEGLPASVKQQLERRKTQFGEALVQNQKNGRTVRALNPVLDSIYKNGSVHIFLRFAGCYAAAKMGYTGSQDLFNSFPSMSPDDKAKALDYMVAALESRHFSPDIARALILKRLQDSTSNWPHNRIARWVRSKFMNATEEYSVKYGSRQTKASEKNLKIQQTIPMVRELIGSISPDKIRSLTHDMNFTVDVGAIANNSVIPKNFLPVTLRLAISLMQNSGLTMKRDEQGRMHFYADTSKLGIKVKAGAFAGGNADYASAFTADIGGSYERKAVADLAFDDDNAATLFLTKMFLGYLDEDDVRTAMENALGISNEFSAEASLSADLFRPLHEIKKPSTDGIQDPTDKVVAGLVGGQSTIILKSLTFGKFGGNVSYKRTNTSSDGVDGHTETTRTEFKVKFQVNPVTYGHTVAKNVIGKTVKETATIVATDKRDEKELMDKVNDFKKALVDGFSDQESFVTTRQVKYPLSSAGSKIPSTATLSHRCGTLTVEHLKILWRKKVFGQTQLKKLLDMVSTNKFNGLKNVIFNYRIKPEAIQTMRNDPHCNKSKILNDDDNYELESFSLEYSDLKSASSDSSMQTLFNTLALGFVSYSNTATVSGTKLMTYKLGAFENKQAA